MKIANMALLPLRTQVRGPAPRETNRNLGFKFYIGYNLEPKLLKTYIYTFELKS